MSLTRPRASSLYQLGLRKAEFEVSNFAAFRDASCFICIFAPLFSWSKRGEMQI